MSHPWPNYSTPQEPSANGYTSPGSTLPFPAPNAAYRPVGQWASERTGLAWGPGTTPVLRSASWATPVFDLRPDLHGVDSSKQDNAVPINRVSGQQLFVALSGLDSNHVGLRVRARQLAHPTDTRWIQRYEPDTDVTAQITTGLDGAMLAFFPPSDGYPCRFWKLVLIFQFLPSGIEGAGSLPDPLPTIAVQGGIY